MLSINPSLSDQVYDALVDEICDGRLAPGTHLVQERLADRFGISRQPIQQAMARLRADGVVEELGRRGLFVAPLDAARMRDHYGIRTALDRWAAEAAARRVARNPGLAAELRRAGERALEAGAAAVATADVAGQVRCDDAFHRLIYDSSGNALVETTAEPHWRYLRRAMGAVLRLVESPDEIWRQHRAIFDAISAREGRFAMSGTLRTAPSGLYWPIMFT